MSIATIDINSEARQRFKALFSSYENSLNGQRANPLHIIRRNAMERLDTLDFPTLRHEDWKYTSVARILRQKYQMSGENNVTKSDIEPFLYEEAEVHLIVFVNGVLREDLGNYNDRQEGLQISTIEVAMQDEKCAAIIAGEFEKMILESRNPFVHLNAAFARGGLFISVAKGIEVAKPVHILHITTSETQPVLAAPLQMIYVAQDAHINVLESYHGVGTPEESLPVFTTTHTHIIQKNQSRVGYFKLQNLPGSFFLVHQGRVDQTRDSSFTGFTADLNGRIIRNNMDVIHHGENILSNLYGVFMGAEEQHIDNQTLIDHATPNCQSNEWYKGILTDSSRGVFNGKVMVRQDAQKTNAFQQNNALILSEQARMDTKPQLEIFADDVKCSHGATIGQMNEEAIFYLRSRGLSEPDARALLQLAFIQEVTSFIEIEYIKDHMVKWISTTFEGA